MDELLSLIARVAKTGGTVCVQPDPVIPEAVEIRVEIPGQTEKGGTDGFREVYAQRDINGALLLTSLGRMLDRMAADRHLEEERP